MEAPLPPGAAEGCRGPPDEKRAPREGQAGRADGEKLPVFPPTTPDPLPAYEAQAARADFGASSLKYFGSALCPPPSEIPYTVQLLQPPPGAPFTPSCPLPSSAASLCAALSAGQTGPEAAAVGQW